MQIGLILKVIRLKLFFDHYRLHKSQDSLEIANPLTRTLGSICFPPRYHLLNAHSNIHSRSLDITSKNNVRQEIIKVRDLVPHIGTLPEAFTRKFF